MPSPGLPTMCAAGTRASRNVMCAWLVPSMEPKTRETATPGVSRSITTMAGPRPSTCTKVLRKSASAPPVT